MASKMKSKTFFGFHKRSYSSRRCKYAGCTSEQVHHKAKFGKLIMGGQQHPADSKPDIDWKLDLNG